MGGDCVPEAPPTPALCSLPQPTMASEGHKVIVGLLPSEALASCKREGRRPTLSPQQPSPGGEMSPMAGTGDWDTTSLPNF